MSPTIDELFKRYQQKVPDATEVDFLDEVSRYQWNGWGRTIQEAAEKLVEEVPDERPD